MPTQVFLLSLYAKFFELGVAKTFTKKIQLEDTPLLLLCTKTVLDCNSFMYH